MRHSVVVVADDLTGAVDTVHGFATRGHDAAVIAVPPADGQGDPPDPESSILGVNTDSRYSPPREAAVAVSELVTAVSASVVYKKIDSTLRGNISVEVDAALRASGSELALFAPAFPATGRVTVDGVHYVDDVLITDTEYGTDTNGPSSATLSELFGHLDRSVETISRDVVEAGSERIAEKLASSIERASDPPVVICDARTDQDLAALATAGSRFNTLYVGSGGLAEHVPVPDSNGQSAVSTEPRTGAPLGVVGSANEATLAQLARVPEEYVVELDAQSLLTDPVSDGATRRATERLQRDNPVVLTAATDRETVERTVDAGHRQGLSPNEVGERVASGLAETAGATFETGSPSGLLYTGGETAVAGLQALDSTTIRLSGRSVEAGVPVGSIADGSGAGTPLITKAGGFGTPEIINNSLEILTHRS